MDDALAAIETGKQFEDTITAAGKLEGLELEDAIKKLTVELNTLSISASLKVQLRDTLGSYAKKVVAWKKVKAAAKTAEVTAEVIAAAESAEGEKIILRVDVGTDTKAAKAIQQAVGKKIKDKAFFLVSADEAADR